MLASPFNFDDFVKGGRDDVLVVMVGRQVSLSLTGGRVSIRGSSCRHSAMSSIVSGAAGRAREARCTVGLVAAVVTERLIP